MKSITRVFLISFAIFLISMLFFNCTNKKSRNEDTQERIENPFVKQDSIDNHKLKALGGVSLVGTDSTSKCNLRTSRYVLNRPISDSLDLFFVVSYVGQKTYQRGLDLKAPNCPYPVMCVIYFYKNWDDVKLKDNLASYSVTPPTGTDVYINARKFLESK